MVFGKDIVQKNLLHGDYMVHYDAKELWGAKMAGDLKKYRVSFVMEGNDPEQLKKEIERAFDNYFLYEAKTVHFNGSHVNPTVENVEHITINLNDEKEESVRIKVNDKDTLIFDISHIKEKLNYIFISILSVNSPYKINKTEVTSGLTHVVMIRDETK